VVVEELPRQNKFSKILHIPCVRAACVSWFNI